jgi:hypothetical protein
MGGVMGGVSSVFKSATGQSQKAEEYARRTRTSPADAVCSASVSCHSLSLHRSISPDFLEWVQRLTDQVRDFTFEDEHTFYAIASADTVEAGRATGAMSYVSDLIHQSPGS